jgi:3-phenylpropionate/trans-cinnamate dioxygenase ferredoxin subunit
MSEVGPAMSWHRVASVGDLEMDDVMEATVNGRVYAIYRISTGWFATDGLCTHEQSPLARGFVSGEIVECAKHNARFHIPGRGRRAPAGASGLGAAAPRRPGGSLRGARPKLVTVPDFVHTVLISHDGAISIQDAGAQAPAGDSCW